MGTRADCCDRVGPQSVALPAGTIGFRHQSSRLDILDEPKLLEWCKRNAPAAVVTSERILKTAIMTHFTATGECPDGAQIAGGALPSSSANATFSTAA